MEITTEMIKKLREKTGAGMMDCKRALEASNGEMAGAVEFLRKKGAALADKRSDRSAKEGVIVASVDQTGKRGALVEVNCETDFVARGDDFVSFAESVLEAVARHGAEDVGTVNGLPAAGGRTIADLQADLLAKVGEKIDIRRVKILDSKGGTISSYVHVGNKIGVLVEIVGIEHDGSGSSLGRNIAMQIAAMSPIVVSRDKIPPETVEREMDIYRTQASNEGKPAQMLERIASGKLEKFYQEVCLLEQTYIRDSTKTIRDLLADASDPAGRKVDIIRFERFHLGEE